MERPEESDVRTVIQRVREAAVCVDGVPVAAIGPGLVALVGVGREDEDADAEWTASKIADLRVFEDEAGKMNLSVRDVAGMVLIVSQFTLYGDCRKGRRPSFTEEAPPETAQRLYLAVADSLRRLGVPVRTGRFQACMQVQFVNDGPVTLLLDSRRTF